MKAILSIAACLVLLPAPLLAQPGPQTDRLQRISELVEMIKNAPDEDVQDDAAYDLVPVGVVLSLSEIKRTPDALIDDLAALLSSDNQTVVQRAALTLGAFRIGALHAVPALRQALADFRRAEEADAASSSFPRLRHGSGVGDAICRALDAIGAPLDYRNCFNGNFIYPGTSPPPAMLRWARFIRR
jgi:hypothetical protein